MFLFWGLELYCVCVYLGVFLIFFKAVMFFEWMKWFTHKELLSSPTGLPMYLLHREMEWDKTETSYYINQHNQ